MGIDRRLLLMGLAGATGLSACGAATRFVQPPEPTGSARVQSVPARAFPEVAFAAWDDREPEYLMFPGDEIEVATPTANELTRTHRVGPDGRISLPLVGQIMAADRSISELEADASAAYASQLRRPIVEVTLRQAGPIRVWVDGEVRTPGVYEIQGDINAYQAVIQAGGFLPTARQSEVALIRRGPGGTRMMRAVDLRPRRGENIAVRRGDIIFVPRSTLGEVANFVSQIRNALPVGFSYAINGQYQQF